MMTTSGEATIAGATVRWGAATDTGLRRTVNQDSLCTTAPVFVVADGMGGQAAGDRASQAAVAALAPLAGCEAVTGAMLTDCLRDARARIALIDADGGLPPGTTLTGVILTQDGAAPYWMVINIGDSRSYRWDADGLRQVSIDHSEVQELVDAGRLAAADAERYPRRNVITRALLASSSASADVWLLPMVSADRMLICSDGLTKEVDDDAIAGVLGSAPDPEEAATRLVQRALHAGGRDNVTVLVVDAMTAGDAAEETVPTC